MKKILLYLFICLSAPNLMGQSLEVSGGIIRNSFYDRQIKEEEYNIDAKFNPGWGYSFGISVDDIKPEFMLLRFTLRLEKYGGKIYTFSMSPGGDSKTDAETEKYCLGLAFYPLYFHVLKNIHIGLGFQLSYLLGDKTTGYQYENWPGHHSYVALDNHSIEINRRFNYGIISRLAYNIHLTGNWYIVPQYLFYMGANTEFKHMELKIRSLRHCLEIGMMYKM
jgi:hypothetical protein